MMRRHHSTIVDEGKDRRDVREARARSLGWP
jgi:hypothetical protein